MGHKRGSQSFNFGDRNGYQAPRPVFTRVIVCADKPCSQCEEVVLDGEVAFKDKRLELWCGECVDYISEHRG